MTRRGAPANWLTSSPVAARSPRLRAGAETRDNAFIAGLSAFGLAPRATVELAGSQRRLERIVRLLRNCRYSFHDLSRVSLDRNPPATPRFNMPFELGLAASPGWRRAHEWFVFEERRHRLFCVP